MPTNQTPSEKLEAQLPKIDRILTPQEYMRIIDLISSDNRLEPNNQDFIIWETILAVSYTHLTLPTTPYV